MSREKFSICPSEYTTFDVDVADKSAFGLPNFVNVTKGTKQNALESKFVGILEHRADNTVVLYKITESFEMVLYKI